jgi:hypothetical protein
VSGFESESFMSLLGHAQSPLFDFQWLLQNHVVMLLVTLLTLLCQVAAEHVAAASLRIPLIWRHNHSILIIELHRWCLYFILYVESTWFHIVIGYHSYIRNLCMDVALGVYWIVHRCSNWLYMLHNVRQSNDVLPCITGAAFIMV